MKFGRKGVSILMLFISNKNYIFWERRKKKKGRSGFSYHISTKFWFNNNVTIKTITIQLNLHIIHQIVHKYI